MFDWNCPYATTARQMPNYLFCEKRKKSGVDYTNQNNLINIFCGCQRYCKTQCKPVTTGNAQACYEKTKRDYGE